MPEYKVPVSWMFTGDVTVQAKDKADLLQKLCDRQFREEMPLGEDPEYVDDSFRLDWEYLILKNPDASFTMSDIDKIDNAQTSDG